MALSKIKLPDNTTEDIHDARLPSTASSDNGKMLVVSNGAWAKGLKITVSSTQPTAADGNDGDIWIVV